MVKAWDGKVCEGEKEFTALGLNRLTLDCDTLRRVYADPQEPALSFGRLPNISIMSAHCQSPLHCPSLSSNFFRDTLCLAHAFSLPGVPSIADENFFDRKRLVSASWVTGFEAPATNQDNSCLLGLKDDSKAAE
ncbi:hypothetical protein FA13DRAFT_136563 [Coprinellus micaceus]|uniref:Uncharacterized protein n=1 Tax=Coprinellus micaceus TaxID=71717 RepID=A0A4Y7SHZ1_COPMI|nr:hypothetical protein FA13DRAFT_136563 [Coprinellus micaceus]